MTIIIKSMTKFFFIYACGSVVFLLNTAQKYLRKCLHVFQKFLFFKDISVRKQKTMTKRGLNASATSINSGQPAQSQPPDLSQSF